MLSKAYVPFLFRCSPDPEFVVAGALRNTLLEFLLNNREQASIAKFIVENHNLDTMEMFRVTA